MSKPRFLPKFPVFVQDWFSSMRVRAMTLEQRGAYMELLLLQWQEGGLPGSAEALLRLAGLRGSPDEHALVLEAFPVDEDGQRRNMKCAQVRAEAEAFCEEQARKASLGGKARASAHGQPGGSPGASRGQDPGTLRAELGHARGVPGPLPESAPPTPTPTPKIESSLRSDSPPPVGSGGLLPGIGEGPPKPAKREPTQHQIDRATVQPIWLRAWESKFGKPYGGLVGSGKSVRIRCAALRNVFVRLNRDEAAFREHVERFLADPPFKARQNPDPIALQEFFDSVQVGLSKSTPQPTANGNHRNTRRPDGTRPGEYPEPLQFPHVVSLTGTGEG